jgi:hypothetical protein
VSFLAARAAPTAGFWVALAGGVALARVAAQRGARQGYGASVAAMLESVAIMGPARFGVPLTQALTAPLLGRLEARSVRPLLQILACAALRLLHNTVSTAFFVWIVAGFDAYSGSYEALGRRVGIEIGPAGVLALTAAGLLGWAAFASWVQVGVYRRGLRRWPEAAPASDHSPEPGAARPVAPRRFDPRAVALAAALGFALLLAGTEWPLLVACAGWLALVWALARPDREAVPTGLVLAAMLAGGALAFTLGGGLGLDLALRRALRAALLVLVATWLRAAAGAEGLREVFRRGLLRVHRLPSAPEAGSVLGTIASERRLLAAGRSLTDSLSGVRRRPLAILDAVLDWVAREAGRFRGGGPVAPLELAARPRDPALVALALVPALALFPA